MQTQPENAPSGVFVPLYEDSLHDLASPVSQVSTMVELFIRRQPREARAEDRLVLNLIRNSCAHLLQLVTALQEYVRIAGSRDDFRVCDGNTLVTSAIRSLDSSISESHAQLTREDMPKMYCDPDQMVYAFTSLIDNAIKFRNEIRPEVRIAVAYADGDWLFAVRDNGIGIDHRHHESVFHMFTRLNRERYSGAGAGLAITRRIVEHHGGRIWLESEPGQGSTFYFTLPARQTGEEAGV